MAEFMYRCAKCGATGWHRSTQTKPQICRHRADIYRTIAQRAGKRVEIVAGPVRETR